MIVKESFLYDPKADYISTIFSLSRSVLPAVLRRHVFWIFMAMHLLIRYLHFKGRLDFLGLETNWHEIGIISGITIFFEVFYTNSCFSRYTMLYKSTRALFALLYDVFMNLRIHISPASHQHVRSCARYLLASVALFFSELDGELSELERNEMSRLSLLSHEELDFLYQQTHEGALDRSTCLLQWSADVAAKGTYLSMNGQHKLPGNMLNATVSKILKFKYLQHRVSRIMDLPVPYPYFHLLTTMIVLNLFLWAYVLGVSASPYPTFVFFFASLIFIGMMELASQLANPFGFDEVDFPVNHMLEDVLQDAAFILERDTLGGDDAWAAILMREGPLPKERQQVNFEGFLRDNDGDEQEEWMPRGDTKVATTAYAQLQQTQNTKVRF